LYVPSLSIYKNAINLFDGAERSDEAKVQRDQSGKGLYLPLGALTVQTTKAAER
jgi:hypothetical protein